SDDSPAPIRAPLQRAQEPPPPGRAFVQEFSAQLNKDVEYIPADAMDALTQYAWPGNVRELENLIERAVLLSPGKELRIPFAELKPTATAAPAVPDDSSSFPSLALPASSGASIATLEETERQHIL